jgi:hypothetical protein
MEYREEEVTMIPMYELFPDNRYMIRLTEDQYSNQNPIRDLMSLLISLDLWNMFDEDVETQVMKLFPGHDVHVTSLATDEIIMDIIVTGDKINLSLTYEDI